MDTNRAANDTKYANDTNIPIFLIIMLIYMYIDTNTAANDTKYANDTNKPTILIIMLLHTKTVANDTSYQE